MDATSPSTTTPRSRPRPPVRAVLVILVVAVLAALLGACGPNYQARIVELRGAISTGQLDHALAATNAALGVDSSTALPAENDALTPLLLLERATLLHAAGRYDLSARDFQLADDSLEVADLSDSTAKDIAEYLFSDAQANYRTPPYEKLMLNTLNQLNYLAMGDLEGARVEARRIGVLQRYFPANEDTSAMLALGAYLAGFTFERSGRPDEAILWYKTALDAADLPSAERAIASLSTATQRKSDEAVQAMSARYPDARPLGKDEGEVLVVFESGRAPFWIGQRLPVGAAVALVGSRMSHEDRARADELVVEGLFKWVNFPEMVVEDGWADHDFSARVAGGSALALEPVLDVERGALTYYDSIRGDLVLASLTRMLARFAASKITEGAVARGQEGDAATAGFVLGKIVEGAMIVADTPDTRSWNTVPRQYSIARMRLPVGTHTLELSSPSRGLTRTEQVRLTPGGYAVVVVHGF